MEISEIYYPPLLLDTPNYLKFSVRRKEGTYEIRADLTTKKTPMILLKSLNYSNKENIPKMYKILMDK